MFAGGAPASTDADTIANQRPATDGNARPGQGKVRLVLRAGGVLADQKDVSLSVEAPPAPPPPPQPSPIPLIVRPVRPSAFCTSIAASRFRRLLLIFSLLQVVVATR